MESLLDALEQVANAYVDRAEALFILLRCGGQKCAESLVAVLEHGVQVLDALSLSSPRRERKRIDALCEQLEALVGSVQQGGGQIVAQLSTCCRVPDLTLVSEALRDVEALPLDPASGEALSLDPVAREGVISKVTASRATISR